MDFFTSQDQARKKTGRLVFFFIASVILMMVVLHFIVATALTVANAKFEVESGGVSPYLDPMVMLAVAAGTMLIVGLGSGYKMSALSAGGHTVAESLGGKRISPNTTDYHERKLLNVVEEMAIAAGVAVPPVFLLENERGINAFAAGYSIDDAVIGVTRGCIELLDRDELQGVMAHEFSHILNGDMRLNIRLIGILHGILIIGMMGYFVLRFMPYAGAGRRRSSSKEGGGGILIAIMIIAFGMIVVGFVGTFFGNLIKAAVSRQREYLADASAVQFTRNPQGIGEALQKIGGYSARASITHPNGPQASHLFFGEGITSGISSMFATHPPLDDRIKRVLPSWDGKFQKVSPFSDQRSADESKQASQASARSRFEGARGRIGGQQQGGGGMDDRREAMMQALVGVSVLEMIGKPSPAHVEYATSLIQEIPDEIKDAAREVYGARAIVFALLLDRHDEPCRTKQMAGLQDQSEYGVFDATKQVLAAVDALDQKLRLPLIDLALPALRGMSNAQYRAFVRMIKFLVEADEEIDLFEWSLQRILLRHLVAQFSKSAKPPVVQYYGLQRLTDECAVVLSTLAHAGVEQAAAGSSESQAAATKAFNAAMDHLELPKSSLLDKKAIAWDSLDAAITKLNEVAPALKRKLIEACALCAAADQQVTADEAELLRAFADGLGIPMPPMLPGQPLLAAQS